MVVITPELAQRYNIPNIAGVLISDVDPSSTAADAGLTRGDIIREVNRMPVRNKADYNKIISSLKGDALVRVDKGYLIVKQPGKE